MSNLQINIEEIKTVKLAKNENLVFKVSGDMDETELKKFKKQIVKALPTLKGRVMVVTNNVEITKVKIQ